MKMRTVLIGAVALMVAGCGLVVPIPVSMHLYPIEGPLAAQKPPPVISATGWGTVFHGSLSVKFPDGETFVFRGSPLPASPSGSTNDDLASVWDSVYGAGHYRAHVLGSRGHWRGVLRGNRGTTLILETNSETQESPPEGVARDSHGNTFKVSV